MTGAAPDPTSAAASSPGPRALREVGALFLRLGVVGFGGPAAHIAMMRDEVVRRRGWLDDREFLDLVGATNLIPGPNSTELAIHLGHRRAGARGLVLAGVAFIAPAVVIVSILAWAYQRYGTDPAVVDVRYGVLPVIVAIVGQAVVGLTRTACTSVGRWLVALAALGGYVAGVHELVVLVLAGVGWLAWTQRHRLRDRLRARRSRPPGERLAAIVGLPLAWREASPSRVSLTELFAVFLEIGSVLYGSGYVLLAFLQRNLVDQRGWLTGQQLLDAVAVGQITPGPVFTTATFVGWQIHGPAGAAVATVGIFLPSFLFVALLGRIVPWMQRHAPARAFLDGVTLASLGLMAGVLVDLADVALRDAATVVVAVVALGVLVRTTWNSAWLIGAGLAVGVVHALAM